jgi:hypothetical protein
MKRAKSAFWAAKRIGIAVLVLGVALSALSCGKDGNIYGDIVWDYNSVSSFAYIIGGGFPSTGLSYGASYLISPGTWAFQYNIWDGVRWWPGPDGTWAYSGTYSVTADPGSFPFISGKDTNFELYCSYYGLAKYGSVSSIAPVNGTTPAPKLGTQTWTQNGLRIEVTTKVVQLSPEDLAKLSQGIRK